MSTTRTTVTRAVAALCVTVVVAAGCAPSPPNPLRATSTIPAAHGAPRECGLPGQHAKCTAWKAYYAAYSDLSSRAIRQISAQADGGNGVMGRFYSVAGRNHAVGGYPAKAAKASWSGTARCQRMITASALTLLNFAYKDGKTDMYLNVMAVFGKLGNRSTPWWSEYWKAGAQIAAAGARLVGDIRIRVEAGEHLLHFQREGCYR